MYNRTFSVSPNGLRIETNFTILYVQILDQSPAVTSDRAGDTWIVDSVPDRQRDAAKARQDDASC